MMSRMTIKSFYLCESRSDSVQIKGRFNNQADHRKTNIVLPMVPNFLEQKIILINHVIKLAKIKRRLGGYDG